MPRNDDVPKFMGQCEPKTARTVWRYGFNENVRASLCRQSVDDRVAGVRPVNELDLRVLPKNIKDVDGRIQTMAPRD